MTEQEKRALALQIMVQETAMLRSHTCAFHEENKQRLNASLQRTAKQRQVYSNLAQNGITWNQLREAYHEAFIAGHDAMLSFKLSFFYAGSAIAYHETFGSKAEETAAFIQQLCDIAEDYPDRPSIEEKCFEETGINTAFYDESSTFTPGRALVTTATATRKDREAVERMKKTGITQRDLEYEKQIGYSNGWYTGAGMGACYASAALALQRAHRLGTGKIEVFLERIAELEDEEISAYDIIERAKEETGVDVSEIAKGGQRT